MSDIVLESPAYALLQWWVVQKDKNENLLSTNFIHQSAPVITTAETSIGRKPASAENAKEQTKSSSQPSIILCDQKTISRQHASICWSEESLHWMIKCCSKNGMTLNSKIIRPEHGFVALADRSTLRMGSVYAYFTLPIAVAGVEVDTKKLMSNENNQNTNSNSTVVEEEKIITEIKPGTLKIKQCDDEAEKKTGSESAASTPRMNFSSMIHMVFDNQVDHRLLKKDIIDRCLENNPEIAAYNKRKNLVNAVGSLLKKNGVQDSSGLWALTKEKKVSPCPSPRNGNVSMKRKASDLDQEYESSNKALKEEISGNGDDSAITASSNND